MSDSKIKREHLIRKAFLYIRQSTLRQVHENTESTKRQYAIRERLISMGWDESRLEVIDSDLGQSGADSDGRKGFQYLVSEVSLGRAGVIAGIEVSRLSRSSSDWNKLLQIAALSDTIIMDEDGIYNVNDFNDRLLLGLKGTLSEAELHYLKSRMRGGLLNKAKRGELVRPLATGYVYDDNEQIIKDPDAQVQEAITQLFNSFKRIGSAGGVVREHTEQGLLFPNRQCNGFNPGDVLWGKLTLSRAAQIIKNPLYAGIYVYGKQQIQYTADGRKKKTVPKEQYHAWLPNSHPAYISEAQFDENCLRLSENSPPRSDFDHSGAVREGPGLLQGIALCGVCGKKMNVNYSGRNPNGTYQPMYVCNYGRRQYCTGSKCQNVVGGNIDLTIGELLLETINPLTVDAAVSIQREMAERREEIIRLYGQQLERVRYEMDLAKRRYLRVDPDNRLVAAELERDWNQKVAEHESAKMAYDQKCEAEVRAVDEELELTLRQLVSDFPKIWSDPHTSNKEKKRIARLVLEDVTITADSSNIVLGIRFKGGATKVIEILKSKYSLHMISIENNIASEIKLLRSNGMSVQGIADTLNEKGLKNVFTDKPFSAFAVRSLMRRQGYSLQKESYHCNDSNDDSEVWLSETEKMIELGVGKYKFRRLRESGKLVCKTVAKSKRHLYKAENSGIKNKTSDGGDETVG
jgi:DNA invertase Pin-like site-specific DNA recombinase